MIPSKRPLKGTARAKMPPTLQPPRGILFGQMGHLWVQFWDTRGIRILKWYKWYPDVSPQIHQLANFGIAWNSWWTIWTACCAAVWKNQLISQDKQPEQTMSLGHLIPNFWSVAQWSVSTAATARTLVTFGALELTKSSTWKATRMATLVLQDKSIKKATCNPHVATSCTAFHIFHWYISKLDETSKPSVVVAARWKSKEKTDNDALGLPPVHQHANNSNLRSHRRWIELVCKMSARITQTNPFLFWSTRISIYL